MTANKTVVLLINLGTPEEPTVPAVRRYLAEFLSDRRVIRTSPWIWQPILHGLILRTRPRRSAEAYQKIWTPEGSPLLQFTLKQAEALGQSLGDGITVLAAMRYGQPSVRSVLNDLAGNVEQLVVFPLYPQYSSTTTASTFDAVDAALGQWAQKPELILIKDYHDHPLYIDALVASIRDFRARHGSGETLLFSYHGLPKEYLDEDEPYLQQCLETSRKVAEKLGLDGDSWLVSFQSRVGPKAWLTPYTDETVRALARKGMREIDVVCPGFAADCLETLEEIAMQNRDFFVEAGGESLRYIPALNDRPDHIQALASILHEHL